MQPNLVSFVVLHFSRFNKEAINLLVLNSKGGPLRVWAQPDWKERVDHEDQRYLSDLICEWHSASAAEIPVILDEWSRQSHGPLRVFQRGDVSAGECRALTEGLLEQTNGADKS
jgi:hypothetical protein